MSNFGLSYTLEIYDHLPLPTSMTPSNDNSNSSKGFVLIVSVLLLSALLVSGAYLLTLTNAERKISNAQKFATINYYLSESGINEMIWKIENDTTLRAAFLAGTLSTSNDINRSNVFGDTNASYQVSAVSTATAEAQVIATSTYQIGDSQSQRVVKSYLIKAIGSGEEWEYATFSGGKGSNQNGNITIEGSPIALTINGGRLHANQDVIIKKGETIVNDAIVSAANNIIINAGGVLTLNNSSQESPTSTVDMPQIDFDSSDPFSWKNRATITYTQEEFEALTSGTSLTGIIFVEAGQGSVDWEDKDLTINGVLVVNDKLDIDLNGNTFTVNNDVTYGSGVLAKDDLDIDLENSSALSVDGLLYSNKQLTLNLKDSTDTAVINGALIGWDSRIDTGSGSSTINFIPEFIQTVLDPGLNPNSPLIQIDHWEEQY